jgi:hypothetical protein
LDLAKLPEEAIFKDAVAAVKKILSRSPPVIQPSDVSHSPTGEGTLYFAQAVQGKVIAALQEQFGDLWQSIERWLLKQYEKEIATAQQKGPLFMARGRHEKATGSTTGGGDTRGEAEEDGGDEAGRHGAIGGAAPGPGISFAATEPKAAAATAAAAGAAAAVPTDFHGAPNHSDPVDSSAAASATKGLAFRLSCNNAKTKATLFLDKKLLLVRHGPFRGGGA